MTPPVQAPFDRDKEREAFSGRLRETVRRAGGNAAVARASGIPESTLNKWLAGAEPGALNLSRIAETLGTSLDYLVGRCSAAPGSGIGPPGSGTFLPTPSGQLRELVDPPVHEGFVPVPRLEVQASAGGGQIAHSSGEDATYVMMLRESWLRSIGIVPRNAQFLTATGDSMEPTIRDGDLLLVDRGIDRVVDNGIYIVVLAGLVMVKRVQVLFGGAIVLASDNAVAYPRPETIPADQTHDLVIEGRVKWFGRSI